MLVDEFLFLIPITPDDWLFIGHHAMVIIYTIGSLLIGRGAISCLILMCIGEITSPMQNSWYLAKDLRGYVKVRICPPLPSRDAEFVTPKAGHLLQ